VTSLVLIWSRTIAVWGGLGLGLALTVLKVLGLDLEFSPVALLTSLVHRLIRVARHVFVHSRVTGIAAPW